MRQSIEVVIFIKSLIDQKGNKMSNIFSEREVAIVDENPLDSVRNINILREMDQFQKVTSYYRLAYLEADFKHRIKYKDALPNLTIIDIHFKNTIEFIAFYQDMYQTFSRYNIKLILMSCLDDKRFFQPLVRSGIDLSILIKPLEASKILEQFV